MNAPAWSLALGVVPSLVMAVVWGAGALISARVAHGQRHWTVASAGFGCLSVQSLVGLFPALFVWFLGSRGVTTSLRLFSLVGVIGIVLELVGAGLLVAAVASAARHRRTSADRLGVTDGSPPA